MPDIRTLRQLEGHELLPMQQVQQGNIHLVGVKTAVIEWEGEPYEGEVEVESRLYDPIILETKHKTMMDNVTVLPITILDVDNPAGGYTVTIGKF